MRGRFRRWVLMAAVALGALVACNQLVGVDDVVLKQQARAGDDDDSGPIIGPNGDDDDSGPIGDSSLPQDPRPVLGLGFDHTCARMLDSTVKCWGEAFNGQLGDGQSLDASAPIPQDALNPK